MNWLRRLWRNRLLDVGLGVVVVVGLWKIASILPERSQTNDFAHYYLGSRLVWAGANPYATPLEPLCRQFGFMFEPAIPIATNPPVLLWAFGLLAWLTPTWAYAGWVAVQLASLALLLWMIRELFGQRLSARGWWWLCAGVTVSTPVYLHFYYAQVQLPLAVVVLAAYRWQNRGWHRLAVVTIVLAGLLKLYPLFWLPWLILGAPARRRIGLAGLAVALLVVGVVLSGPWLWWEFYNHALPVITRCSLGNPVLNVPSLILNLASAARGYAVPADFVALWLGIGTATGLGLIVGAYVIGQRCADREVQFGLVTVGVLAGTVAAQGHYFVFLVFPVALAAVRFWHWPPTWSGVGLVVAVLLLNCPTDIAAGFLDRHLLLKVLLNYLPLVGLLIVGWLLAHAGATGK